MNSKFKPIENPFSTRHVAPGKVGFLGMPQAAIAALATDFFANGCQGQIIGPHGCGKSTLTFEIEKHIKAQFPSRYSINRKTIGHRYRIQRTPSLQRKIHLRTDRALPLLVLDGIEKLPWLQRIALLAHCRRKNIGLLATSHKPVWRLKVLLRLTPSPDTFVAVAQKLQNQSDNQISNARLRLIYDRADANIREALMICYDEWESQRCRSD